MESYKSDQSDVMDRLLRKQLRSSGATQCGGFDPDLAAAYFEKALSSPEEQSYQLHLSECGSCRKLYTEFFFFASETEPESIQESAAAQMIDIPLNIQAAERKPFFSLDALRAWIFGPQLRWVLPTALVFVVVGTVWFSTNKLMFMKEPSPSAVRSSPEMPAPPSAQSESESKNKEELPSDFGSNAAAPAPLSVQPQSEPNNGKIPASVESGRVQPDAAPQQTEQKPSNVLREFERGGAAAQNAPAQPETELAKRRADAEKETKAEGIPADLAARNKFAESAKSVGQSKDQSAASRTAPAAGAAQAVPPAPAEPPKSAAKSAAPSALLSEAAENKASGSIQGFIIDGAGKIVPGTQLILRDSATGAQRYANADNKGRFSFTELPSGNYLVQAQTETLRKEAPVSLENAQNINNFRMQFDAPPQIALNADELKKKLPERDRLQREESARQEKAKEKDQKGASGDKKSKGGLAVVEPNQAPSSDSVAGARADKDSARKNEDAAAVDDRRSIDRETRAAKAPAKTDKQTRSKTGYNRSETATVTADADVAAKLPSRDGKSAKPTIKTKRVGDKSFVFLEGVWTDEEYLLKEKIKDFRVVKLEFKSEAYNKILNDLPALKLFFRLGEQVTVVYKDAVYAVVKKL